MKRLVLFGSVFLTSFVCASASMAASLFVEPIMDKKECKARMGNAWDTQYIGCLVFTSDSGDPYQKISQRCIDEECIGVTNIHQIGTKPVGRSQVNHTFEWALVEEGSDDSLAALSTSIDETSSLLISIDSRNSVTVK